MKFLTNTYDPRLPDAREHFVYIYGQDNDKQWNEWLEWLKDKIIDDPQPTHAYTVDDFKKMNMVGIYEQ